MAETTLPPRPVQSASPAGEARPPAEAAPPSQRVAVVAVHGVGHHEAGASARAMSNLLLGLGGYTNPPTPNPYGSFSARDIQVPLPGAGFSWGPPPPGGRPPLLERARDLFEERRGFFKGASTWVGFFTTLRKMAVLPGISTEFMAVQLKDYRGDPVHNTYDTVCLEGRCAATAAQPEKEVHIYEMYWADLARPNKSFMRFFFSFYQLLLHLPGLGRIAVDHAALEHTGRLDWLLLQRSYTYAARILTIFIANLLALLPCVAFAPLVLLLGGDSRAKGVAAAGLFAASIGFILWRSQRGRPWFGMRSWWGYLFAAAVVSVFVSVFIFLAWPGAAPLMLTLEWWCVAVGVILAVFHKYDEVRNGSKEMGLVMTAIVAAGFWGCLFGLGSVSTIALRTAAFWMIQYIFLALRLFWVALIAGVLFAFLMERICRARLPGPANSAARARARSALRTSRFALSLSTVLLLLLTIFLWSGVYRFTVTHVELFSGVESRLAPGLRDLPALVLSPGETDRVLPQDPPYTVGDPNRFLEGLLFQSAPPGLPYLLGFVVAGFALLLLMILPSAVYEAKTPPSARNGPSRLLGAWLSSGLNSLRVMIGCFWIAGFALPSVYVLVALVRFLHADTHGMHFLEFLYLSRGMALSGKLLTTTGALLAGSATLLFGIVVKYFGSALDAVLDVDNYLRMSPVSATPRAQMVERYAALLRYLHSYRGPEGRGYDRIVIVAHSLGSLISADLLRFLTRRRMPQLSDYAFAGSPARRLPICFFTMGNPLRQLMNRFFPHLYYWVRPVPDGAGEPPQPPVAGAPLPGTVPPDPAELLVAPWVNFYRGGDYVGRSLWLDDWNSRTSGTDDAGAFPDPLSPELVSDPADSRREASIGLGAHAHYWDRTAPDVAATLDELIRA